MPKTSALELKLMKPVSAFLLERPQTKKTTEIVQRLINSLLKARSSHRRKEYRDRLDKILLNLAVQSEDLVEQTEKKKVLQKRYNYLQTKHSEYVQSHLYRNKP